MEKISENKLYEELQKHAELEGIDLNALLRFLRIYKPKNTFWPSALQREFPNATKEQISLLLNILSQMGFLTRCFAYKCPECSHATVYPNNEDFQRIKELGEYDCPYCGDTMPYKDKNVLNPHIVKLFLVQ